MPQVRLYKEEYGRRQHLLTSGIRPTQIGLLRKSPLDASSNLLGFPTNPPNDGKTLIGHETAPGASVHLLRIGGDAVGGSNVRGDRRHSRVMVKEEGKSGEECWLMMAP